MILRISFCACFETIFIIISRYNIGQFYYGSDLFCDRPFWWIQEEGICFIYFMRWHFIINIIYFSSQALAILYDYLLWKITLCKYEYSLLLKCRYLADISVKHKWCIFICVLWFISLLGDEVLTSSGILASYGERLLTLSPSVIRWYKSRMSYMRFLADEIALLRQLNLFAPYQGMMAPLSMLPVRAAISPSTHLYLAMIATMLSVACAGASSSSLMMKCRQ